jgi:hypothetical protein
MHRSRTAISAAFHTSISPLCLENAGVCLNVPSPPRRPKIGEVQKILRTFAAGSGVQRSGRAALAALRCDLVVRSDELDAQMVVVVGTVLYCHNPTHAGNTAGKLQLVASFIHLDPRRTVPKSLRSKVQGEKVGLRR